ncbi:MAG TPA: glycosyltransferase family 4 protein [Gemmataceae bacterium]|nr:glycosyltransferase family 4 protein [Gemmataceae bacterium]
MRLLFIKETLTWPRSTGHDVHCFHLMQALAKLGHEVSLATVVEPTPEALDSLPLAHRFTLNGVPASTNAVRSLRLSYLQERFRSYWGVPAEHIMAVARAAADSRAEVVITVGLNGLPYLGGVRNAIRVWYAADEWVLHHLAVTRWKQPASWVHIRAAMIKGLYERAYAPLCDRIWVVSSGDRRAMHWMTGLNSVDALYSGVDSDYYRPAEEEEIERSCVFWGRLDFDPNIQALQWFCEKVWPLLRRQTPDAQFRILGFQPGPVVRGLANGEGISLQPNLPDIRGEIARHAVVVLPFQTSGGVKDKLLEAASMAKPIVCTRQACGGLRGLGEAPLIFAHSPEQWAAKILALWADKNRRRQIGQDARKWVLRNHTWSAMAQEAVGILEKHRRS